MITLQSATAQLAAKGAVLHVGNSPAQCYLVGALHWLDFNRVFWFTAHGDCEDDGHVLEFDSARFVDGSAVRFERSGRQVALLTAIHRAQVDDPEDYAVAFGLWQQVEPRTRPIVTRARERHELASAGAGLG